MGNMVSIRVLVLCAVMACCAAAQAATLLVLEKEANALAFIDPESGKVDARVPVGEGPHEIVASADGKLAFVANYGSRNPGTTISVIDVPGRKEMHRVDVRPLERPHGLAFIDGKLYFTAEANMAVGRYDPAANKVDWITGTGQSGTHMVMGAAGGNTLYTANIASDTISVLESGPRGWHATAIPVGKGPEGFDLSPDGKQLWAADSGDGKITIVDLAAKKAAGTIDVHTKRSNRLKFTPDGQRVLVSDLAGGELVIVDTNSHAEIKRLALGRAPEGVLVLAGGSRALIAVSGENSIAVIDLKSLEVSRRIATGAGPDGMAWIAGR
jgi:DNA-binding beta-propeller fold protein YncE